MIAYLIDTHVLLWALDASPRLPTKHRQIIETSEKVHVSIASLWEIAIKASIGKLKIPNSYLQVIEDAGFQTLPVSLKHVDAVGRLPLHHNDPFDRMLIAQAQIENLTLLTVDKAFRAYDVDVI